MSLFVVGLSYKTAPVEVREKLAVQASRLRCHGCRLKLAGNLQEVVVVSTCNRVEIYGVAHRVGRSLERLFATLSSVGMDFKPFIYVRHGQAAVEHLFTVAGGLDSMVIGETEITGQIKQTYQAAQEFGLTGKITNRLFQTALQVAKELRTQTGIGRGSTSVGSVAVDLAERIFDSDLSKKTVMIIGAGRMGEACVKHLARKGVRSILVSNRSPEKAVHLAAEFGGEAVPHEQCLAALARADIVVTSTGSSQTILHKADLAGVMAARRNQPLFLIDIAVPRDVDTGVQELPNVYLYNVDHLESIVRENVKNREHELVRCQEILHGRATSLLERFSGPAPARASVPGHILAGAPA